jgi:hypothetical protein
MTNLEDFVARVLRTFHAKENRGVLIAENRSHLARMEHDEPHLRPLALQR